jgi:hypothetical protein
MGRHSPIGFPPKRRIAPDHFKLWLAFFAETANEVSPKDLATSVIAKSQRIDQNFKTESPSSAPATTLTPPQSEEAKQNCYQIITTCTESASHC